MAITAQFIADFASFKSAVDSAETKLKGFQSGAAQVERQLTRVGDAFSGRKILQEATVAVKALADVGGATTLTAKQQAQLNAQLNEAIAKYTALGQKAPQALLETEKATRASSVSIKGILDVLGPVGTAIAGAFSVGAVINFGKELLRMGDEIVRIHDRTGLTIAEVQQFSYVASQTGGSIEDLTSAVGQLQNRLVSGDKGAANAVKFLRLNLQELTSASPGQQLSTLANSFSQIGDPATRAALAIDLFGKSGLQILPQLNKEFDALAKAAPKMSDDTVRALDKAGDAMNAFFLTVKVAAAGIINHIVDLGGAFDKFAFFVTGVHKQTEAFTLDTAMLSEAQSKLTDVTYKSAEALAAEEAKRKAAADALKPYTDALKSIHQTLTQLAPVQEQTIRLLHEFGVGADTIAKALKLTTDQVNRFLESLQAVNDFVADFSAVSQKLEEAFDKVLDAEQVAAFKEEIESLNLAFQDLGEDINIDADNLADFRAQHAGIALAFEDIANANEKSFSGQILKNLEQFRKRVPELITDAFTGGGGLKGALKAIGVQLANAFLEPFIDTIIHGLASGALKRAFGQAVAGSITGAAIGVGAAAVAGGSVAAEVSATAAAAGGGTAAAGGGLGASVAAFATNPITIGVAAAIGGILIARHFLIGGKQANDIRDLDQGQFGGPGTGSGSGFRKLADSLHRIGDDALFQSFQQADNPGEVRRSWSLIVADLSRRNLNRGLKSYEQGGFVPPGVVQPALLHGGRFGETIIPGNQPRQPQQQVLQSTTINFNVNAVDAASFDRTWKTQIVPRLHLELLTNQLGTVTNINRVVAR